MNDLITFNITSLNINSSKLEQVLCFCFFLDQISYKTEVNKPQLQVSPAVFLSIASWFVVS